MQKNIFAELQAAYPYLSRVETKLAGMILEQPREFIACSMAELSRISGVSQGSINNFSKKFSSGGFPALKLRIAGSLSTLHEKPFTVTDKSLDIKAAMEMKIQESTAAFRNTLEINDEAALKQAVELILAAKKIEIYGVFNSGIVANALCYQLIQLGIPAAFFSDTLLCSVSASMLDSNSLVFAISSSGRTKDIIDAVELAQKNGTPVIGLTADKFSPLAKMADCTLLAATSGMAISDNAVEVRQSTLLVLDTLCAYLQSVIDSSGDKHYYRLQKILNSHSIQD